jgi:hypothetical protein
MGAQSTRRVVTPPQNDPKELSRLRRRPIKSCGAAEQSVGEAGDDLRSRTALSALFDLIATAL